MGEKASAEENRDIQLKGVMKHGGVARAHWFEELHEYLCQLRDAAGVD